MGITAVEPARGDVDKVINALKESLAEAYAKKSAVGAIPAS